MSAEPAAWSLLSFCSEGHKNEEQDHLSEGNTETDGRKGRDRKSAHVLWSASDDWGTFFVVSRSKVSSKLKCAPCCLIIALVSSEFSNSVSPSFSSVSWSPRNRCFPPFSKLGPIGRLVVSVRVAPPHWGRVRSTADSSPSRGGGRYPRTTE
jgi:hypothetical protein